MLPYFILLHEIQVRKNSGIFSTPMRALFHRSIENISYKRQQSSTSSCLHSSELNSTLTMTEVLEN